MKSFRLLRRHLLLAVVLCFATTAVVAQQESPQASEPVPLDQQVTEALRQLKQSRDKSYHVYLRQASLILPPLLVGQEWAAVQQTMKEHHCSVVEAWENGDAVHSNHLLEKKAFTFPNGHALDLYLLLSSPNLDRPKNPARPGRLYRADMALVAAIDSPFPEAVAERRYPKGSVLDAVLASREISDAAKDWARLKKVYVHYGYIADWYRKHNPSGFHVVVEFGPADEKKHTGRRVYLDMASGLDPLKSADGKEEHLTDFMAQDTLSGIMVRGSSGW